MRLPTDGDIATMPDGDGPGKGHTGLSRYGYP
jgi:hypothetical protein